MTKVPLLGDVPMVGFCSRPNKTATIARELLIFVTPKILRDALSVR